MRLREHFERVYNELVEIKIVLARHDENLKNHMLRTHLLEQKLNEVETECRPVHEHVNNMKFLGKIILVTITLVGTIVAIVKAFF